MSLALALLRALIGLLFVGHGAQKVPGEFGGHGPDGTGPTSIMGTASWVLHTRETS